VKAPKTSEETIAVCREVGARMGKEVVVVKESPGFITTRVNALIGNEAFAMLEAGIASAEDIDKALKLGLNHRWGRLSWWTWSGLDVRLSILEYFAFDARRKNTGRVLCSETGGGGPIGPAKLAAAFTIILRRPRLRSRLFTPARNSNPHVQTAGSELTVKLHPRSHPRRPITEFGGRLCGFLAQLHGLFVFR